MRDTSGDAPPARGNGIPGIARHARDQRGLVFPCTAAGTLLVVYLAGDGSDVIAAAGILGVLCSFVPGWFGRASAVSALVVAVLCVAEDRTRETFLVAVLLVGGAWLGRTVSAGFPGLLLIAAAASQDRIVRESILLDERARTELTRARRYQRPLSVITFRVASDRKTRSTQHAVSAGRAMAAVLRVTDFVGVTEDGEAVAILPDTRRDAVADLIARVRDSIAATRASGRIGYATFPDDAVTWQELKLAADSFHASLEASHVSDAPSLDRTRLEGQRAVG